MFGYVKPFVPELKMIENQYYRAAYCGLCRAMQTETGFFSRMSLSYDVTFLVLLRLALTGEIPVFEKKRCFVHPFRKKLAMKSSDSLQYSASVGALLTMHKLRDDAIDERGFDRLFAIILKAFFKKSYKKAVVQTGDLDVRLRLKLEELRIIEQASERSADRPAAVFGDIMAEILSFGLEKEDDRIIAVSLGRALGKWIYLIDALDDMDKDLKRKSYNPFLLLFDGELPDTDKKLDIRGAMLAVLKKAQDAVDLIDFSGRRDLEGLIKNILGPGMQVVTERILFGESKEKNLLRMESGD